MPTLKSAFSALALLALATPALSACEKAYTYGVCEGIVQYYDPNTGELCNYLDCGGGRAPPKTDVPGCPLYKGTAVRVTTPTTLPCWTGLSSKAPASPTAATTTAIVDVASSSSSPAAAASSTSSASSDSGPGESQSQSSSGSASSTATTGSGPSTVTGATTLTTAPPLSTGRPANATTSGGAAGSSSTTVPPSAGNIVGGSWIAVVAGVALGAIAVI